MRWPSTPSLVIHVPRVAHPGSPLAFRVTLEATRATALDRVEATLGERVDLAPHGGNRARSTTRRVLGRTRLAGPTELAAGAHDLDGSIDVPDDALPSFGGGVLDLGLELTVRAVVRGWFDAEDTVAVTSAARAVPAPEPAPTVRFAHHDGVGIEVALADVHATPGTRFAGSFALADVGEASEVRLEVAIAVHETAHGSQRVVEHARVFRAIARPIAGEPIPFAVAIPERFAPTFARREFSVGHSLEVIALVDDHRVVLSGVPVVLGAFRARDGRATPPPIGHARWREVWAEAARRSSLGLANDRLRLEGDLGAVHVTIAPSRTRGRLEATLAFPRLGMGLAVTRGPGLRAALGMAPTATAREPAMRDAFLEGAIVERLSLFDELAIDDARATLVQVAWPFAERDLVVFATATREVARYLELVRATLPPPRELARCEPAWRAFAERLGATFVPASMSVEGVFAGATFSVGHSFRPGPAASSVLIEVARAAPDEPPPRPPIAPPDGVPAPWLGRESVVIELPAPLADPRTVEPIIAYLVDLARALADGRARGPYR